MRYIILLLLIICCGLVPSETTVDNTDIIPFDGEYYTFFWEEPKVTGGCWKFDRKNHIEKDIYMSKKLCKSMENKWVRFYDTIIPKEPTLISKVEL